MRKLWEDHITWTRVFIISAAADLPDKDAATQRLLQNQVDTGNAIKPYYGAAAGDQLTALLRDHILISADVVSAAKANDKPKLDDANRRWSANADQIADFLSKANPQNWPAGEMRQMMHDHLKLTTNEAVARLHGDWAGDVRAYDAVHEQILRMADMLSAGIINQFPNKFK
ncbi:MAG: acetylglutamate kinase [Acidobacteria bacterium]|nr:MAG: acetylglutamate kinase [Acidobacteriota bacterium]